MTFLINIPMGDALFTESKWHNSDWVHKKVMGLYGNLPVGTPRESLDILYRVEPSASVRTEFVRGRVLIQCTDLPANIKHEHIDMISVLQSLTVGATVRFKVKVNVVKTVNVTDKAGAVKTSRRRVPDADLEQWFIEKMQGFMIDETSLNVSPVLIGKVKKIPLYTATFEGTAQISDAALASNIVIKGIGKGRAYGCGLVSVIPVA